MDELEKVIKNIYINEIYKDKPHGLSDNDIKRLVQKIREAGYHRDTISNHDHDYIEPPTPKRKRIESPSKYYLPTNNLKYINGELYQLWRSCMVGEDDVWRR